MPLATPQGTLDFKSVDTITFVGASSNTVIDTTTGSFGVGVDGNGPTSNLHVVGDALITGNVADLNIVSNVNMLHTSNTASIKLNSNVVTEFPRSKKLMKFPRVAMTADNQPTGYVASASSSATSPYNAFDNILYTSYWEPNYSTTAYPNADGAYTGGTGTVYSTNGYTGEYLQIQLPVKIKLYEYSLSNRTNSALGGRQPKNAKIFASNDGSTWHDIHTHSDNAGTYHVTNGETRSFQLDNITETYYKYYRLAVNSIIEGGVNDSPNISDWSLYGTPEYDPEAHGVDVTVKSVPNVPNTDWLEVYYDAKDYTSGVVPDLSTNSLNGTLTNGATFDNSDGIGKFTFDGSNDYISGSIPSTFTGNQTYTFSTWIKPTSHPSSGFIGIFEAGTRSDDDSFGLYLNAGNIVHLAYGTNLATTTLAPVGQWTHIIGTYTSGDRKVYANGVLLGQDTYSALTLAGTTLVVGANSGGTQPFTGSIANFRLFNRALTTDEIYQLYAYQKEYFGHGALGMTLKAGRLGIGTSEPRAALDVRGQILREYNPGEVIEELNTVCNGRPVTVQSGTYTPTNVTASQISSVTHTEINGSNITYIKPVGAKRIYYKFACQWEDASLGAISNFSIRVYHNGAWREQYQSRYTHAATYVNDGNHHAHAWVINEYIFECDADTESQHDGRFLSSKTSYTFQVTWRHHGGGNNYQSRLHLNDFWDGIGTDIIRTPQLTIRAIA
jgi:hypothetical protein